MAHIDKEKLHKKFKMQPVLFTQYMQPRGGLTKDRETHALFYYYTVAMESIKRYREELIYEGTQDPVISFSNLFQATSVIYNVEYDAMAKCWREVDYTCSLNRLTPMPKDDAYRHPHVDDRGIIL